MTKYEKFDEEYKKTVYVSFTAEHKRVIGKRVSRTVFTEPDKVFSAIMKIILKDTGKEIVELYPQQSIKVKQNTFYIYKFKANEIIEYRFKTNHAKGGVEYHIFQFTFKKTRTGFTKLGYSHSVKIPQTIAGFNGKLGTLKFKRDIRKEALRTFKWLDEKFPPNKK